MTGPYTGGAKVPFVTLSDEEKHTTYEFPIPGSIADVEPARFHCPRCTKSIAVGRICDKTASKACSWCCHESTQERCIWVDACYFRYVDELVHLRQLYKKACNDHLVGCTTDAEKQAAFNRSEDCKRHGRNLAIAQLTYNRLIAKKEGEARKRAERRSMASRRSTETYTTNETASGNSPELTTPAPPIPDTIELSSPDTADHAVHSLLSSFINRRRTGCAKKEPATEPPESHQPPKQPSGCQPSASRLSTLHRTSHQRFDPLGESAQRKSKERESQISPAHDSIAVGSSSAAPASSILNGAAGEQANGKRPRSDSMTEGSATEVRATSRASEIKRLKMRLEEISIERRLMELAEEV